MRIRFLQSQGLAYLKDGLKSGNDEIRSLFLSDTNENLIRHLKERGVSGLADSRFECNDFSLDPHPVGADEVSNIRNIDETLGKLPPSIAANERFWAGLAVDKFWNYVRERWQINGDASCDVIRTHFLYGFGVRRSLTRNALARLWWIGHFTKDESRDDPFSLTKFVLGDTDYVIAVLERNYSNNKRIIIEFVDAVSTARQHGYAIGRDEMRELAKYLSLIGGTSILDALPRGVIFEKVYSRAKRFACPTKET